jgi:starch synthase
MQVLHVSAECFPAAKAGGLGDVVGALPKYLNQEGLTTAVVIPRYHTKWLQQVSFYHDYEGIVYAGHWAQKFHVLRYTGQDLGFPLYVVELPGLFDRPGIYLDAATGKGYADEPERNIIFQRAVLQWVLQFKKKPKVIHCHDHHTGLIPYFLKFSFEFQSLAHIPTVFTIHNGNYPGYMGWNKSWLLPASPANTKGMLDWVDTICPLASAIKCAWKVTAVSPGYLDELKESANGLEVLLRQEWAKESGILNGIDTQVWDPATDPALHTRFKGDIARFKKENKKQVCQKMGVHPDAPLITFIGRLAAEKGADLLPDAIGSFLGEGNKASFIVLGTGDKKLEGDMWHLDFHFKPWFSASLTYNEDFAHQLYAASDFLMMPSRVEPCGLNQMYAMRYGTIPIVRAVGGLRDTVPDIGDPEGRGIRFLQFHKNDLLHALWRATRLYYDQPETFAAIRERIMKVDFSWEHSTLQYIELYRSLG